MAVTGRESCKHEVGIVARRDPRAARVFCSRCGETLAELARCQSCGHFTEDHVAAGCDVEGCDCKQGRN